MLISELVEVPYREIQWDSVSDSVKNHCMAHEPDLSVPTGEHGLDKLDNLDVYYVGDKTVVWPSGEALTTDPIVFVGKLNSKSILIAYKAREE